MSFYKLRLIKFSFIIFILISGTLFSIPAKATDMSTATLSSNADAYIYTDGVHGQAQFTYYGLNLPWDGIIHNESTYGWGESVIKFDLSGVPTGSTIDSADMRLYLDNCNYPSSNITVQRIISNWTEPTVNWDVGTTMRTTTSGSMQLTNTPCTAHSWYDFYITDIMKAWTSGSTNYGVRLSIPDYEFIRKDLNINGLNIT